MPSVVRQTAPEVVVLLNLTRDQLDRTHEVSRTSQVWAKALAERNVTVVANAADPHVVDAALAGKPVWVDPGTRWTDDATVCPRCGHLLDLDERPLELLVRVRHAGARVHAVDGRRPAARWPPARRAAEAARGRQPGQRPLRDSDGGLFGVPAEEAAARGWRRSTTSTAGTPGSTSAGRPATLFLAKNPAGWAAALSMIEEDSVLAVGINARIADGTDTSWLYDVPFERLAGQVVGAIGDRRADLAVRLHYAGARPIVDDDLVRLAAKLPDGPLVVAANYTAFREMRRFVI